MLLLCKEMGSECSGSKPHYDITMSKRTRKPVNLKEVINNHATKNINIFDDDQSISQREGDHHEEGVVVESDRKSLKQLIINGEDRPEDDENTKGDDDDDQIITMSKRSSLCHHFTEEEKQLQLVKKHHQQDNNGSVNSLKGMMSRYAKVLSHLVKVKRDHHHQPSIRSKKKHLLRLKV